MLAIRGEILIGTILLFGIVVGIIALAFWLWQPAPLKMDALAANPARSYEEALERIAKVQAEEKSLSLNPVCASKLLTHGGRSKHALLIFHGYGNCPEQFMQLGQRFFELGYNVYLPRMPHHGLADRMSDDLRNLTAEEMVAYANTSFDIARGLGDELTLLGISAGGTLVNWLTQYRDPDYAASLSAFHGINIIPTFLTRPFIHVFLTLPIFYIWWDPRTGLKNPYAIDYSYPRYALQNLAHVLRIAGNVEEGIHQKAPGVKKYTMLINDYDPGVSRPKLLELTRLWRQWIDPRVAEVHFERELKMLHDIITPGLPNDPTPIVYPRIVQAIQEMHTQDAQDDGKQQ